MTTTMARWSRDGLIAGLVAVAALWGGTAKAADELKLGFIDSARIFQEYEGAKDAQQILERESREWEEKAEGLKADFTAAAEELESQRLMLSEDRLKERETKVKNLQQQYEDYVSSIWGTDGRVAQRNEELTKPIIDKVNEILHKICTEEGYSLVLDAAGGTIVYGLPALDLTDRVLEALATEEE
jgi:outer membrane protein